MNIFDMIKEGLRIARTSKSLWLYGFIVGLGATGNNGSKGYVPGAPAVAHVAPHAFTGATALLAIAIVVLIAAGVFMYFVSEGALIEGVTRVRRDNPPTLHEGWRDGLAHRGVLLRIDIALSSRFGGGTAALEEDAMLTVLTSLDRYAPRTGTRFVAWVTTPGLAYRSPIESQRRSDMNESELTDTWAAFEPTSSQRRRAEVRVRGWLDSKGSSLAAEWFGLIKIEPFSGLGLAAAAACLVLIATPLSWMAFSTL